VFEMHVMKIYDLDLPFLRQLYWNMASDNDVILHNRDIHLRMN